MKKIILFFIVSLGFSKSLTKLGLFSDRFNVDNLEAGKYLLEITLNEEKIQKSFIKI